MSPFPHLEASREDFSEIMIFLVQCSTHTTILPGGPRPGKWSKLFSWLVKESLGQRNREPPLACGEAVCTLAGRRALGQESKNQNAGTPRCWDPASGRPKIQHGDSDWVGLRWGAVWKLVETTRNDIFVLSRLGSRQSAGEDRPSCSGAGPGRGGGILELLPLGQRQ